MQQKLLLVALILFTGRVQSQDISFQWATQIGGTTNQTVNGLARDGFNNSIVVGQYEGTVDFDPSAGIAQTSAMGATDAFIAKYDASGNFLWKYHFGNTEQDYALDVAVDGSGNIYVVGTIQGAIDIDMDAGTPDIDNVSTGGYGFLLKLNANGSHIWSKYWDGNGGNINQISQIALDQGGNPIIAGETQIGNIDLDPGATSVEVDGSHRLFYEKLTSSGNLVWYKSLTGYSTYNANFTELLVDASNAIYLSGNFQSIIDFDPSAGTSEYNGNGPYDAFIVKYGATGDLIRVQTFYNDFGPVMINDIQLDGTGALLATGSFTYTTDFDPDLILSNTLSTPTGTPRGFVLQLSASGTYQWAKTLTSEVESGGLQIIVNNDNDYVIAGYFSSTADFNPDPNQTEIASAVGGYDIFISKYTSGGTYLLANTIGSSGNDRILSMQSIPGSNAVLTGGYFENTMDFDPNSGIQSLISAGARDGFIAKFSECAAQQVNTQATGCGEYTWNNEFYVESGIYTQTFTATSGCDSIMTLNLTIAFPSTSNLTETACGSYSILDQTFTESGNYTLTTTNAQGCDSTIFLNLNILELPASPSISISGNTLTCSASQNYQWFICENETTLTPIIGATEASYSPESSGNYAVQISNGNCTIVSECIDFVYTGWASTDIRNFNLYPNPTQGQLTIKCLTTGVNETFRIIDAQGRLVMEGRIQSGIQSLNMEHLPQGLYLIHTNTGMVKSFVKN